MTAAIGEHVNVVGVVGAGVMGRGVAQTAAQAGLRVILVDVADHILAQARQEIRTRVRFQPLLAPGTPPLDPDEVVSRIAFSVDYLALAGAEFVIENVTEKWAVKKPVYEQLNVICQPSCVLGVNTSAIPITRVAGLTSRPATVIGMHFMNPVPLKPTVEVIRGAQTSETTIATARSLLARMGKDAIVVNDSPGFVTNRVMMLMVNEAIMLLQERVATVAELDQLFKQCIGHKMGPLETADLIGLDTVLLSIEVLYEEFKDTRFRPCPLLRQMVDDGLFGRKSGRGFYTYSALGRQIQDANTGR
jgi:3-hydroxybutyryl-CoA dehydrogenase